MKVWASRLRKLAMNTDLSPPSPGGEVIVYESEDGEARVDVRFEKETVWLTQRQMAAVFQSTPQNIVMHLRNVFSSKELDAESTSNDFLVVRTEGKRSVRRALKHYNLDAIISIGYRVNSKRAVRFRQWATRAVLETKECVLITGVVIEQRPDPRRRIVHPVEPFLDNPRLHGRGQTLQPFKSGSNPANDETRLSRQLARRSAGVC